MFEVGFDCFALVTRMFATEVFFFAAEFLLLDFFSDVDIFFTPVCVYMSNFLIQKISRHRGKKKSRNVMVFQT